MRTKYWLTLSSLIATGVASAQVQQSSVQLQGVVDVSVNYAQSGDTKLYRLEEGGAAASRIVFRGTEDLGGDLHAGFMLESGVNPVTGAGTLPGPTLNFSRQSFLYLSSDSLGAIEMGRLYTPMFNALVRADPFNVNALYSSLNLVAATDSQPGMKGFTARASNMIRYRSPAKDHLVLDLGYAFGDATVPHNGNIIGANVGWREKDWEVSYDFQQSKGGTAAAPSSYKTRWHGLSGSWAVSNNVKLYANYVLGTTTTPGTPVARTMDFAARWNVGESSTLLASIGQRRVDHAANRQFTYTLGYDYALSKRTALYARYLQLNNAHDSGVSLADVPVSPASGNGVRSLALGVRHFF